MCLPCCARCRDAFFHLELEDRTRLFDSAFAARLEQEQTVRGVFVRRARRLLAEAPAGAAAGHRGGVPRSAGALPAVRWRRRMILRTLELRHFGRFAERTLEFRRGMNLVLGPNEAGKSTLMEAIPAVLFGSRNKERFRPWGRQGSCEAALVLEKPGGTVRLERDILTDRVRLSEHDDLYQTLYTFEGKAAPQGRSSERSEYLEQLQRLLGITEEEIFRASLFFGQGSLEISGQGLAGKIKALLSGFIEVDYDRVLQSLQEDYFALTRENPWGKDKTRDRELDEVRRRMGELERRWFAAREGVQELAALRARIAGLQQEIEADRGEFGKGERYLAWVRRQWHLEEKKESLAKDFSRVNRQSEKVGELEQQRQDLEKELARTGLPRQVPEELTALLVEAEEIRKELIGLQGEAAAMRQELLAHANPSWKPWAGLTAALLLAGGLLAWLRPAWLLSVSRRRRGGGCRRLGGASLAGLPGGERARADPGPGAGAGESPGGGAGAPGGAGRTFQASGHLPVGGGNRPDAEESRPASGAFGAPAGGGERPAGTGEIGGALRREGAVDPRAGGAG